MDEQLRIIESEIEAIKKRNLRVESDKAWETSWFRIFSITIITYIIASAVLYFVGVHNPLLNAFVPTIGYFLSTQSLPFLKKWWANNYMRKNKNSLDN